MIVFVGIALALWLVTVVAWLFLSRAARTANVERVRNRLAGTPKKPAKGKLREQSLIEADDTDTGRLTKKVLQRFELTERLKRLIEQAGLRWRPARLIHACLALFLAGFAAVWVWLPSAYRLFAIIPALLSACIPILYVLRKRRARLRSFEEVFPDTLEFVARSMRAGHAFAMSIEMIYKEFREPVSGEFRRTFEEHNLGLPLDVALQNLGKRVPSLDVHFFVSAVLLQKRTGGNLAEILEKLAYVIRERFKLRGKIRAISAHGRMTGTALSIIPLAVAGLMLVVNPDYVRFFVVDEIGNIMLAAAIALQVTGYLIIRKIVSIEV
jgi:tight adherence protein B